MLHIKKYSRFLRISFWRVLNEPHSAHRVAMGAAVGTAIGFGPTFGFQLIPALAISLRYKFSKIATLFTVFVTNPLTIIPIYSFEIYIGDKIWGSIFDANIAAFIKTLGNLSKNTRVENVEIESVSSSYSQLFALGSETLVVFVTGSLVCSFLFAVCAYFATKLFIENCRKTKKIKKVKIS